MPQTDKPTCRRCGTCCKNGGPALHHEDVTLLQNGTISHADLVTIRHGEPAYSPLTDQVEPSVQELVKLAGTAASWCCRFLATSDNSCRIYLHRPLECRLLNCRAPETLLEIIGKETLCRFDLINASDPVRQLIDDHNQRCSYEVLNDLCAAIRADRAKDAMAEQISGLLQKDIALRQEAIHHWQLPPAMEMFIFGRPLFLSVQQQGITVFEKEGRLQIKP